jgi:hypothetical protein
MMRGRLEEGMEYVCNREERVRFIGRKVVHGRGRVIL